MTDAGKPRKGRQTSADLIREALSDRIAHGILLPGEALDETTIAAEFGVSRTPVREALRQLEANGMALSRPHRGTVVVTLAEAELDQAFVVMAELEALCAGLCASVMSREAKAALVLLHEAGADPAREGALDAFRAHNERFHNAVYRGSGNAFLMDVTLGVRRRLSPFRKMQFELFRRTEGSQAEHGRIVAAIFEGDAAGAAAAMRDHILIVRRKVDEAAGRSGAPSP